MPRSRILDYLQAFRFQLYDAKPWQSVFTVLAGFNAVSVPKMAVETEVIEEANQYFSREVVKKVKVDPIVCSRGASWLDVDFWKWIKAYAIGEKVPYIGIGPLSLKTETRRDLILVQFMPAGELSDLPVFAQFGVLFSASKEIKYLPGKIWFLKDCIPKRYVAGTDLDAGNEDISIAELEIQPRYFEEWNVSSLVPGGAEVIKRIISAFL